MLNRRHLLFRSAQGLGAAALLSLLKSNVEAKDRSASNIASGIHFPGRAKRIIYLFMHGGPAQVELFDYKPELKGRHGQELPPSLRGTQRLTGMTSGQKAFPVVAPPFRYQRYGQNGTWVSELLPRIGSVADDICVVRSMFTEAINHDPAVTFLQTGHQQPGRPSFGSWLSYGLGSENDDLPAFVVLLSKGSAARPADPLYARLWGAGFLPSNHQGVNFRSSGDPVLYLNDAPGISRRARRDMLDSVRRLNQQRFEAEGDPEILTRISQYEMAFRMQTSVPELTNLDDESESTIELYGEQAQVRGSFAANCLLARRLVERGVRFVQLYHRGWDQHYNLPSDLRLQCQDVDQASAALIIDLKQRGLLDETLVVWGGEFGRTTYCQGDLAANGTYGRDHHGGCFTIWLAGGGIRGGMTYGATDDFSFNVAENPLHVHDLNATLLHCLGIDHTRLTFRFQGREYRLTDVHGSVVRPLLS